MAHEPTTEPRSEDTCDAAVSTRPLTTQASLDYIFDARSSNVFKWLEWIVMGELELSFCEKSLTRNNVNLQPVTVTTLKKYMFKLVDQIDISYNI